MKIPSWWPHDNTPAPKDFELERMVGRIGVLAKRMDEMENRFTNLWLSVSEYAGRIKALETQNLWDEAKPKKKRKKK